MAKWQRMIGGKDAGNVDYGDMCKLFSDLSGAGVRYEKLDGIVTLYTDGDPEEVLESIIVGGITGLAVIELIDEIEDLKKEMTFEKNARMN